MKKYRSHFIAGKWVLSSGALFTSSNPATNDIVWEGCQAGSQEVDAAVNASKQAFGEWSNTPFAQRAKYLEKFRDVLATHIPQLSAAISEETGKPLWESKNEVASMASKVTISIEAYRIRCHDMMKPQHHGISITRHKPHGVMAIFGPFNFPAHLPNGHIVPALLAGNTIVFKPSELAPGVAELTIKCWEKCKLPAGILNLVQGGQDTGKLLAAHTDLDGLLFTGSYKTGKFLAEQFAAYPEKIIALEMGGNNPFVIGSISDMKTAAYLTVQSAYLTSGQRCTCARRLIVPKGKHGDAFLDELMGMINRIRIGAYTDHPEPFMGPVVSVKTAEALISKQKELFDAGGKPLIAMSQMPRGRAFLTPGLIDMSFAERLDEEIFGPVLQLVRVRNFDEAIVEANKTKYGLAAGLLSDSIEEYEEFFKRVRAGIVNWNTQLTGASSAAPFGGIGKSGNNRPSAFYAADYCAYPVASLEAGSLAWPAEIAPGFSFEPKTKRVSKK